MEEELNIIISNLANTISESDLVDMFQNYGNVDSTTIVKDKYNINTMRFGFVEMSDESEAINAISKLNGKNFKGRKINVHQARTRPKDRRKENRGGGRRRTDQN